MISNMTVRHVVEARDAQRTCTLVAAKDECGRCCPGRSSAGLAMQVRCWGSADEYGPEQASEFDRHAARVRVRMRASLHRVVRTRFADRRRRTKGRFVAATAASCSGQAGNTHVRRSGRIRWWPGSSWLGKGRGYRARKRGTLAHAGAQFRGGENLLTCGND